MHGASLAQVKQQMAAVSSSSYLDQGQALSPPPTTNRESRDHPSAAGARTPGNDLRRKISKDSMHGTPLRHRGTLSYDGVGMTPRSSNGTHF